MSAEYFWKWRNPNQPLISALKKGSEENPYASRSIPTEKSFISFNTLHYPVGCYNSEDHPEETGETVTDFSIEVTNRKSSLPFSPCL
jgi:hypothetical protein